jgi:uncharacterized protein (TIGR00255 family)
MTGFGKAVKEFSNKKISVEIKSLNSKQLDINTRIPNVYREKEIEIRNLIAQTVERGKVDVTINADSADKGMCSKINLEAVESYHQQISDISRKLNVSLPDDWFSVILKLPETIKTDAVELDEAEWNALKGVIREALKAFEAFRVQEGKMLEQVFRSKISAIETLLHDIDQYDSERVVTIKERLSESIKKLDVPAYDANRLEQEMIYYIERLDVSEEKSRLTNHLQYFIETLETEKSQGRKLGFIAQEMGREINTLGSKSNHATMQKIVVQMKDELEQIKEQIFNVL